MTEQKVETIVIPEEFLVRWGENGEFMGAHLVTQTKIMIDGALVSSKFDAPIALADTDDPRFIEVVGQIVIDQQTKIEKQQSALAELESDRNDQIALVMSHEESIARLQQKAFQMEIDCHDAVSELQGQLIDQRAIVAQLQPENALLRSEVDRLSNQNSGLLAEIARLQAELDTPIAHEQEL